LHHSGIEDEVYFTIIRDFRGADKPSETVAVRGTSHSKSRPTKRKFCKARSEIDLLDAKRDKRKTTEAIVSLVLGREPA